MAPLEMAKELQVSQGLGPKRSRSVKTNRGQLQMLDCCNERVVASTHAMKGSLEEPLTMGDI